MVEFYDLRWDDMFGPRGQFVSRYYLTTLGDADRNGTGLALQYGTADWTLTGRNVSEAFHAAVNEYVRRIRNPHS